MKLSQTNLTIFTDIAVAHGKGLGIMIKIMQMMALALALMATTHKISSVETSGSWVYRYDEKGTRYKTLSASSVGEVKGYSSTFFVSKNGSWIYLYDSEGRRYKTMSYSSVGDVTGSGMI